MELKILLIVEDEAIIRFYLHTSLQNIEPDITILTAVNGKQAWEIYQNTKPKLIITDVHMPEMDGLELIHKIREEDKETPIIILTGFTDDISEEIHGWIRKPVNLTILTNLIKTYIK